MDSETKTLLIQWDMIVCGILILSLLLDVFTIMTRIGIRIGMYIVPYAIITEPIAACLSFGLSTYYFQLKKTELAINFAVLGFAIIVLFMFELFYFFG